MTPAVLDDRLWFPDPRLAVKRGPHAGLVAVGGDLSVPRLLLAYRSGLFPWTADPVTWWSPEPRGIIDMDRFRVSRSLARTLRKCGWEITFDQAFREVVLACATAPRPGGWISPEFVAAYTELHRAGHAHSVECWRSGELVGGVYGVAVGGFTLFDTQMVTPATAQIGAVEIPRTEYLRRLADAVARPATCKSHQGDAIQTAKSLYTNPADS